MLPLPTSSRQGKHRTYPSGSSLTLASLSSPAALLAALRTRARLTNLAVVLLVGAFSLSALLNLAYLFGGPSSPSSTRSGLALWSSSKSPLVKGWDDAATLAQFESGRPLSIETTVDRDTRMGEIDHLVMVPGHAIWTGHDAQRARISDDDWVLEPMQKGGSVKTFVRHIEAGASILEEDPHALLVFSGGATRPPPSPPLPEGQSYHRLATLLNLLPSTSSNGQTLSPEVRAVTEEFALDSYENLLFSIARFREVTGRWPKRITVVGYGMKRNRFTNLHRAAIRFPLDSFDYIGIDDEGDTTEHYAGELKYGYTPFLSSPSGCHPPLSIKRQIRNPFSRYHPYHTSCPELTSLFEWCPPAPSTPPDDNEHDGRHMQRFDGHVPWDSSKPGGGFTWSRETD